MILPLYGRGTRKGALMCVLSAECNTDHQLLRIKTRVKGKGDYCQLRNKISISIFMSIGGANSGADMYREVEAGQEVLGQEGQQHPDWFRESSEILEPLFQRRNLLYTKWLSSGCAVDH